MKQSFSFKKGWFAVCAVLLALCAAGCGKKDDAANKTSVDSSKPPADMEALRQRSGATPAKTGGGQ